MLADEMIALVERYFSGVDGQDFDIIRETLTEDCVFTVETHGVELQGLDEIAGMFKRLWSYHRSVRHEEFVHVPAPDTQHIASRFMVVNSRNDGGIGYKSNCNFFEIQSGKFSRISVYMAGENTLDRAGQDFK